MKVKRKRIVVEDEDDSADEIAFTQPHVEDNDDDDDDDEEEQVQTADVVGGAASGQAAAPAYTATPLPVWGMPTLLALEGRNVMLLGTTHWKCNSPTVWTVTSVYPDRVGHRIINLQGAGRTLSIMLTEATNTGVVVRIVEEQPPVVDSAVQTTGIGGGGEEQGGPTASTNSEVPSTYEARAGPSVVRINSGTRAVGKAGASKKRAVHADAGGAEDDDDDESQASSKPPPKKKHKSGPAEVFEPGNMTQVVKVVVPEVKDELTGLIRKHYTNVETMSQYWKRLGGAMTAARKAGPKALRVGQLTLQEFLRLLQDDKIRKQFENKILPVAWRERVMAWVEEKEAEQHTHPQEETQGSEREKKNLARIKDAKTRKLSPLITSILSEEDSRDLMVYFCTNLDWTVDSIFSRCSAIAKVIHAFKTLDETPNKPHSRKLTRQALSELATTAEHLEAVVSVHAELKGLMSVLLGWAGVSAEVVNEAILQRPNRKMSSVETFLDKKTFQDYYGYLHAKGNSQTAARTIAVTGCGLAAALATVDGSIDTPLDKESLRLLLRSSSDAAVAATLAVHEKWQGHTARALWRIFLSWVKAEKVTVEEVEGEEVDGEIDSDEIQVNTEEADAHVADVPIEHETPSELPATVMPAGWPSDIAHDRIDDLPRLDGLRVSISLLDTASREDPGPRPSPASLDYIIKDYPRTAELYHGRIDMAFYHFLEQYKDIAEEGSPLHAQVMELSTRLYKTLLSNGYVPSEATHRDCPSRVEHKPKLSDPLRVHGGEGGKAEGVVEGRLLRAVHALGLEEQLEVRPSEEGARPDRMMDLVDPSTGQVLATLRLQIKRARSVKDKQIQVPFGIEGRARAPGCYKGYVMLISCDDMIGATTNHELLIAAGKDLHGEAIEESLIIPDETFKSWVCSDDEELVSQLKTAAQMVHEAGGAEFRLGDLKYPLRHLSDFRGAKIELSPQATTENVARRLLRRQLLPSISLELFGTGDNDGGVVDAAFVCCGEGEDGPPVISTTNRYVHFPDAEQIDTVQLKTLVPPGSHRGDSHKLNIWHKVNGQVQPYHAGEPIDLFVANVSSPDDMIKGAYIIPAAMFKMMGVMENSLDITCHPPLTEVVARMSNRYAYKHAPWMASFWFTSDELTNGTFATKYMNEIRPFFVTRYKKRSTGKSDG